MPECTEAERLLIELVYAHAQEWSGDFSDGIQEAIRRVESERVNPETVAAYRDAYKKAQGNWRHVEEVGKDLPKAVRLRLRDELAHED